MKFLILTIIITITLTAPANLYKEKADQNKHSLYTEHNDGERISADPNTIPAPVTE
jgi:hypothetical protein